MGARISADWSFRGMRSVILENADLRVAVLTDYGAKIVEFKLKRKATV